ncbi:MAG: hypothetical protein AAF823_06530 [Planctomycetota bacterium]
MSRWKSVWSVRAGAACVAGVAGVVGLAGVVGGAWGVQPQRWEHATEADFEPGAAEGVVVTNLGDLRLARAEAVLAEVEGEGAVVHDAVAIDGVVYLAVGPEPAVMSWDGETLATVAEVDGGQVFHVGAYGGELVVGVSGASPAVMKLDGEGGLAAWAALPEGVAYVWDTAEAGGDLIVATGPEGGVYRVAADGSAELAYDAEQANILTLAASPTADGLPLYAGTDTEGLIYRWTAGEELPYVVYDCHEPEVAAIVLAADGTVFAGTADAERARPGSLNGAVSEENGRPDEEANEAAEASAEPAEDAAGEPAEPAAAAEAEAEAEAAEAVDDDEAEPAATAEQLDRLRELVRGRLMAARRSGSLQAPAGSGSSAASRRARPAPSAAGQGSKEGNAVYRIDTRGFVSEVFRDSVMVLDLALVGDRLFVATGPEGRVFRVDPGAGETATLADLDAEHATVLLAGDAAGADGAIVVGTAGPGSLRSLGGAAATSGVYTSPILDATQVSLWGAMHVTAEVPAGAGVAVETRAGNVNDPEVAPWSPWLATGDLAEGDAALSLTPREVGVGSPPARFFQYRLTLTQADEQAGGPTVRRVTQTYITPNLAPKVTAFTAAYPETSPPPPGQPAEAPATGMNLNWEVADPNGDRLVYTVAYRPAGTAAWLTVVEDHADTSFEWQTRNVADGHVELRVTASDAPDNPGDMAMTHTRRSDPVLVDNTPPAIEGLAVRRAAGGGLEIAGVAADELSPIASLAYAVDSADDFQALLPDDLIADSTREEFTVKLPGSADPAAVVTIRVIDTRGNPAYRVVSTASAP